MESKQESNRKTCCRLLPELLFKVIFDPDTSTTRLVSNSFSLRLKGRTRIATLHIAENKSKLITFTRFELRNIYPTLTLSSMVQKAFHVFHLVTIALLSCRCPPGHRKSCEAGVSCLISTNTAILMHLGYHRQCRDTNIA